MTATARHVAALTGAGISAESGLPTFRGAGGLWRGLDPMQLATRQAFHRDPELVWSFYNHRRQLVRDAKPNPAHVALVELSKLVPRLTLVTQNVDRLHQRAGSADVIELHGNLDEVRCSGCHVTTNRAGETLPDLPTCDACRHLLRPAVVWFGETLPHAAWERAEAAVLNADVSLVVGTSAIVYPAAGLSALARGAGHPVIEINLERTDTVAEVGLYGPAGTILPRLVDAVRSRGSAT